MSERRVPHVREVAVMPGRDAVVLGGFTCWLLVGLIEKIPGGVETIVARAALTEQEREDVLTAVKALRIVGGLWRLEQRGAASVSGNAEEVVRELDVPSNRATPTGDPRTLSSREAASVLGLTDRQIRGLAMAGRLPGRRGSDGRWAFLAADVAAERDRRVKAAS
jgi:hypothetical protein